MTKIFNIVLSEQIWRNLIIGHKVSFRLFENLIMWSIFWLTLWNGLTKKKNWTIRWRSITENSIGAFQGCVYRQNWNRQRTEINTPFGKYESFPFSALLSNFRGTIPLEIWEQYFPLWLSNFPVSRKILLRSIGCDILICSYLILATL